MNRNLFFKLAALLFLIAYSAKKYFILWPPTFNFAPGYVMSVGLVILLTGIIPLFLPYALTRSGPTWLRVAISAIGPFALSAAGYATYWTFMIRETYPAIELMDVVPRSVTSGFFAALILVIDQLWRIIGNRPSAQAAA